MNLVWYPWARKTREREPLKYKMERWRWGLKSLNRYFETDEEEVNWDWKWAYDVIECWELDLTALVERIDGSWGSGMTLKNLRFGRRNFDQRRWNGMRSKQTSWNIKNHWRLDDFSEYLSAKTNWRGMNSN